MKIIISMLAVLFSILSYSQKTLVEFAVLNNNNTSTCELIFTDTMSTFAVKTAPITTIKNENFFVKKYNENTSFFNENFMNIVYFVKDTLHNMQWEITNDTMTILGKLCHSATTNFRGRTYKAFYCSDYYTTEGPWKFGGLPGLIVYIKSTDNFIEWKAIEVIENYTGKFTPPDLTRYRFVNWSDYVRKYKLTIEKYIKLARSNGTLANETSAKIKIDAVEIFYPELQTGEGIKF